MGTAHLAANLGWSLDMLTEISSTFSFRLSVIFFACSSEIAAEEIDTNGCVPEQRYGAVEEFYPDAMRSSELTSRLGSRHSMKKIIRYIIPAGPKRASLLVGCTSPLSIKGDPTMDVTVPVISSK